MYALCITFSSILNAETSKGHSYWDAKAKKVILLLILKTCRCTEMKIKSSLMFTAPLSITLKVLSIFIFVH